MRPYLPLGKDRLETRDMLPTSGTAAITSFAYFGPAPTEFVSKYEITGSLDDIGTAPVYPVVRDKSGAIKTVISGPTQNEILFHQKYTARVTGGTVTVEPRLFRATQTGTLLDDISNLVVGAGRVTIDPAGDPIWTFETEALWDDFLPDPYQDWIAPVVDLIAPLEDGSGNARTRYRYGLYKVRPYPLTADKWGGTVQLRGYDALWTLRADVTGSAYTVAAGTNLRTAITTILSARGYTTHNIEATSETLPKKRTWKALTNWLTIINDLCKEAGFYPLWVDQRGTPTTRTVARLAKQEPAVVYTGSDVIDRVDLEPDEERFGNHIVVLGNAPSGGAFRAERINKDAASPTSITRLGFTKAIYEEGTDYKTQNAVDKRADYLMDRAQTMWVRATVQTMYPREFDLHEAIAFDLETNAGQRVMTGKWRTERCEISIGGPQCHPVWTLAQLQDFDDAIL